MGKPVQETVLHCSQNQYLGKNARTRLHVVKLSYPPLIYSLGTSWAKFLCLFAFAVVRLSSGLPEPWVHWQSKALPTTKEDGFMEHLSQMEIHKFLGPHEIHMRVMRELCSGVVRLLSIILERLWQLLEFSDWEKANIVPIWEGQDLWRYKLAFVSGKL